MPTIRSRERKPVEMRDERCVCGGTLMAVANDPEDWRRAVEEHNLTLRHREWVWHVEQEA